MTKHLTNGDNRLQQLKKTLLKEGKNQSSPREKRVLQNLRVSCEQNKDAYFTRRNVFRGPGFFDAFMIGNEYDLSDSDGELLGKVKILDKLGNAEASAMTIEMLDPLRAIIYNVKTAKRLLSAENGAYIPNGNEDARLGYS